MVKRSCDGCGKVLEYDTRYPNLDYFSFEILSTTGHTYKFEIEKAYFKWLFISSDIIFCRRCFYSGLATRLNHLVDKEDRPD